MGRYSWSFWRRNDASRGYSQNQTSESNYHECTSGINNQVFGLTKTLVFYFRKYRLDLIVYLLTFIFGVYHL